LYKSWLAGFCRRHPQVDKYKIVFDNQAAILAFDQPLPGITDDVRKTIYVMLLLDINIILE
jgi:hypothetical protein